MEIVSDSLKALADGGLDALAEFWNPDINWRAIEGALDDVGQMHGRDAARRYVQDWFETFDNFTVVAEELLDAGDHRVGAVQHLTGRARQSGVETDLRYAVVYTLHEGKIARVREYATAPKPSKPRGWRGRRCRRRTWSLSSGCIRLPTWITSSCTATTACGRSSPKPWPPSSMRTLTVMYAFGSEKRYVGLDGLRAFMLDWTAPWVTSRIETEKTIDLGERVLVLNHDRGCREGSTREIRGRVAAVWTIRDGKIARLDAYTTRADALEAVGLSE